MRCPWFCEISKTPTNTWPVNPWNTQWEGLWFFPLHAPASAIAEKNSSSNTSTTLLRHTLHQIYSGIKFSRTFLIQSWMRGKSTLHAHWLSKNDVVMGRRRTGMSVHFEMYRMYFILLFANWISRRRTLGTRLRGKEVYYTPVLSPPFTLRMLRKRDTS